MKKLFALILICSMLFSLLGGCGTYDKETPNSAESSNATETEGKQSADTEAASVSDIPEKTQSTNISGDSTVIKTDENGYDYLDFSLKPESSITYPLTDDNVSMTFWCAGPNQQAPISSWEENLVYSSFAERTGIDMQYICVASPTMTEKLNLLIASGDYPDIFGEGLNDYSTGAEGLVEDGIIIDMAPYLEQYAPNYSWLRNNVSGFKDIGTTDSGYVVGFKGLILNYSGISGGFCIRQDWLDNLGLDNPVTYDDYENVLKAFLTYTDSPMAMPATVDWNELVGGFNLRLSVENGDLASNTIIENNELVFCPTSDNAKSYLTLMHKWYEEGLFGQDLLSSKTITSDMVLNDTFGVWKDNGEFMDGYKEQGKSLGKTIKAVAASNPVQQAGDKIANGSGNAYLNNGSNLYMSVSTACEYPELAISWCDYRYSEKGMTLCTYGKEELTFEYNEDGKPMYTDTILNNPDMSYSDANTMYLMTSPGYLGDNRAKWEQVYSENLASAYKLWFDSQEESENDDIAYYTYTVDESEEVSSIMSDISTYISESYIKFLVGDLNLDSDWDSFCKWIEDHGINEALDILADARERYNNR